MSGDGDTYEPLSGASLGLGPESRSGASSMEGVDVPEVERYEDGGLLGRGGMGEVRSALDRRLGRVVALKRTQHPGRRAERQLIDEAAQTARLAHPGIVPVHDLGRDAHGRPFYTMPVIRGRSLVEVAAGASMAERLRLVRHLLDACQAVAYAHSEGLLNRDIKPANIMLGRFGETLVVDWGLAGPVGARPVGLEGETVGTPGYMSPEQRRGEPLTPASDVYSLGCTLFQLLADRLPSGPGARLRDVCADAPADLATIVERAIAEDPTQRYPDARALAEDVAAWFEGRRVATHSYSLIELLGRAWAAWRVSILVAVLAVVSLVAAVVVGFQRTAEDRDHARAAEQAAVEARQRSDHALALAQTVAALDAMSRDQRAEAEVLATSALSLGESRDARGVLSRFDPRARPRLRGATALPPCAHRALSASGARVACASDGVVRVLDLDDGGRELARWDRPAVSLAFGGERVLGLLGADGVVRVYAIDAPATPLVEVPDQFEARLRGGDGPSFFTWVKASAEVVVEVASGLVYKPKLCDGGPRYGTGEVALGAEGGFLVACLDGAVHYAYEPSGEAARLVLELDPTLGPPYAITLARDAPRRAAVGFAQGTTVVFDLETGAVLRQFSASGGGIQALALAGDRLAVQAASGDVTVWDVPTGLQVARLPAEPGPLRWLDRGLSLRVVGDRVEDWVLPASPPWPHLRPAGHGVSTLAVAPDGLHLAVGLGDGRVQIARLDRDGLLAEVQAHGSVVKDVEFSPDAHWLAVVYAQTDDVFLIELAQPDRPRRLKGGPGRRLAWLLDGRLVVAPYDAELRIWTDPRRDPTWTTLPLPGRVSDMETEPGRAAALFRDGVGGLWRLGASLESLGEALDVAALAGEGDLLLRVTDGAVLRRRGAELREVALGGGSPTELALSPGADRFAVGAKDGTVTVWDTDSLAPLAVLRGHTDRISALAFDPTGAWLVSGSWDGDVRLWSTTPLAGTSDELRAAAERAWGRDAEGLSARTARESR